MSNNHNNVLNDDDEWVWIEDDEHCYLPARVLSKIKENDDSDKDMTLNVFVSETKKELRVNSSIVNPIRSSALNAIKLDDLIQLEDFTEADVLHSLRSRYFLNKIYTYTSTVLIAINPNKPMKHLYNREYMENVRQILLNDMNGCDSLAPHPFVFAHMSFREMVKLGTPQSIIISGESGAGKTESTKIILSYLSYINECQDIVSDIVGHSIENKIIAANPIIEAFGNATTIMNHNSSRFGKYMEVFYDEHNSICSGSITHYLLEKARIVSQTSKERNFHIFYQLYAAAAMQREEVKEFINVLTKEHNYTHQQVDQNYTAVDEENYDKTINAMKELGFLKEEINDIFTLIVSILHLGNIKIIKKIDSDNNIAHVPNVEPSLLEASRLLGVDSDQLLYYLIGREINVRDTITYVNLSDKESMSTRDALAKRLYSLLFDWIIRRINKQLSTNNNYTKKSIGILDIYGFELFEINRLGQLFINYANEKLQYHFLDYVIKRDVQEFLDEGLDVPEITVQDNLDCLQLLEDSIWPLLEEEVLMPKGNDISLITKMEQRLSRHKRYKKSRFKNHEVFTIVHYAGNVTYNINGFVSTNRDKVEETLIQCLRNSNDIFIKSLLYDASLNETPKKLVRSRSGQIRVAKFLSAKFKDQLSSLMKKLKSTHTHFLRCIKPNNTQEPEYFIAKNVLKQLRYSGIDDVIRLRQSRLPIRIKFTVFVKKFNGLLKCSTINNNDDINAKNITMKILNTLSIQSNPQSCFFGKTKLFLSNEQYNHIQIMLVKRMKAIISIQTIFRSYNAQKYLQNISSNIKTLQAVIKAMIYKQQFIKKQQAIYTLQSVIRMKLCHYNREKRHNGIIAIQAYIKMSKENKKRKEYVDNAKTIQLMWKAINFRKKKANSIIVLQSIIRMCISRRRLVKLRREKSDGMRKWMGQTNEKINKIDILTIELKSLVNELANNKNDKNDDILKELKENIIKINVTSNELRKEILKNEENINVLNNSITTIENQFKEYIKTNDNQLKNDSNKFDQLLSEYQLKNKNNIKLLEDELKDVKNEIKSNEITNKLEEIKANYNKEILLNNKNLKDTIDEDMTKKYMNDYKELQLEINKRIEEQIKKQNEIDNKLKMIQEENNKNINELKDNLETFSQLNINKSMKSLNDDINDINKQLKSKSDMQNKVEETYKNRFILINKNYEELKLNYDQLNTTSMREIEALKNMLKEEKENYNKFIKEYNNTLEQYKLNIKNDMNQQLIELKTNKEERRNKLINEIQNKHLIELNELKNEIKMLKLNENNVNKQITENENKWNDKIMIITNELNEFKQQIENNNNNNNNNNEYEKKINDLNQLLSNEVKLRNEINNKYQKEQSNLLKQFEVITNENHALRNEMNILTKKVNDENTNYSFIKPIEKKLAKNDKEYNHLKLEFKELRDTNNKFDKQLNRIDNFVSNTALELLEKRIKEDNQRFKEQQRLSDIKLQQLSQTMMPKDELTHLKKEREQINRMLGEKSIDNKKVEMLFDQVSNLTKRLEQQEKNSTAALSPRLHKIQTDMDQLKLRTNANVVNSNRASTIQQSPLHKIQQSLASTTAEASPLVLVVIFCVFITLMLFVKEVYHFFQNFLLTNTNMAEYNPPV